VPKAGPQAKRHLVRLRAFLRAITLTVTVGCTHGEHQGISLQMAETIHRDASIEATLVAPNQALTDQLKTVRSIIDKREHTEQDITESNLSRLESQPGVYASVQSPGFSTQEATLFNTNGRAIDIDLSEYFLKPIRAGVQRIGLSTSASLGHALALAVEGALKDAIRRSGLIYPINPVK
jgi:hypothetical protein